MLQGWTHRDPIFCKAGLIVFFLRGWGELTVTANPTIIYRDVQQHQNNVCFVIITDVYYCIKEELLKGIIPKREKSNKQTETLFC